MLRGAETPRASAEVGVSCWAQQTALRGPWDGATAPGSPSSLSPVPGITGVKITGRGPASQHLGMNRSPSAFYART